MDLQTIVRRYLSGETPLGTAESEILSYAASYAAPDASNKRDTLKYAALVMYDDAKEYEPERLYGFGRLLCAALAVAGERDLQVRFRLALARRLRDADAPRLGLPLIFDLETLATDVEEGREMARSAKLLRLTCYVAIEDHDGVAREARVLLDEDDTLPRPQKSLVHASLAASLADQGRYDEAVAAAENALANEDDLVTTGEYRLRMGRWLRATGRFDRALVEFEKAERILRAARTPRRAAFAMSEQGITWYDIGEPDRSMTILRRAAALAAKHGDSVSAARWLQQFDSYDLSDAELAAQSPSQVMVMASSALRQKEPNLQAAKRLVTKAVQRMVDARDRRGEVQARNLLSVIHAMSGHFALAFASADVALRPAETLNDPPLLAGTLTNRGLFCLSTRRLEEGRAALERAITVSDDYLATAPAAELRQAINAGLQNTFEHLASTYARSTGDNRLADLIRVGQRARAVNFAAWLGAHNAVEDIGDARSGELVPALLQWRAAENDLERRAMAAVPAVTRPLADQTKARTNFEQRAAAAHVAIDTRAPRFDVGEIAAVLRPDECVVDIFCTHHELLLTAFDSAGKASLQSVRWEESERIAIMTAWQSATSPPPEERSRVRGRVVRSGGTHPSVQSVGDLAAELRQRIGVAIANAARELSATHLIIVPHRETAQLPFWVVAEERPEVSITVCHGTNALPLLRRRARSVAGKRVSIGDATASLVFAEREVRELAGFDEQAPRRSALLPHLADAALIHFAGHGVFNAARPHASGLVVSDDESQPTLLTVSDLLGQTYAPRCYLAVLSACSSGLPRLHPASEFIGLPAALFIAGARNVIGSLWPVDDCAAYLLMIEFYRAMLGEPPILPSAALAHARRALCSLAYDEAVRRLRSAEWVPKTAHPYAAPEYSYAFQHFGAD